LIIYKNELGREKGLSGAEDLYKHYRHSLLIDRAFSNLKNNEQSALLQI
jgi:hypothetical protein